MELCRKRERERKREKERERERDRHHLHVSPHSYISLRASLIDTGDALLGCPPKLASAVRVIVYMVIYLSPARRYARNGKTLYFVKNDMNSSRMKLFNDPGVVNFMQNLE
jgi:hypothetical protein